MISAIFKRDMLLAIRRPGDVLTSVGFFLMISTLFPLAIGPNPETLSLVTSSIVWIAVLLASLPSFDRLFIDDFESGFLDRLIMRRVALWEYALVRIISHFCLMGLPLIASLPILALFFAIELASLPLLAAIIAIGLLGLTLLGAIAASLTLGARRSSILSAILILPLAFPIVIFGTLASQAVLDGAAYGEHLSLLGALCLALLVLSPAATFYALRTAIEER